MVKLFSVALCGFPPCNSVKYFTQRTTEKIHRVTRRMDHTGYFFQIIKLKLDFVYKVGIKSDLVQGIYLFGHRVILLCEDILMPGHVLDVNIESL